MDDLVGGGLDRSIDREVEEWMIGGLVVGWVNDKKVGRWVLHR